MFHFLKIAIIWCVAIIVGYFVWQIGAARKIVTTDPDLALSTYSQFSTALSQQNEDDLVAGVTADDLDRIESRSQQILRRAPLSYLPFLHIALATTQTQALGQSPNISPDRQRALYQHAKRRKIMDGRAVKNLLLIDFMGNDQASAMRHANDIMLIDTKDRDLYFHVVALLYARLQGRDLIDSHLKNGAEWRYAFLRYLIRNLNLDQAPSITNSLNLMAENDRDSQEFININQRFMAKLVSLQAYRTAHDLWLVQNASRRIDPKQDQERGQEQGQKLATIPDITLVYDAEFQGLAGLKPFNWALNRDKKFFSEIDQSGGVYVSFADKRKRQILKQIILLEPGTPYRLSTSANWDYQQRQGVFTWEIQCLPSGEIIAEIHLSDDHQGQDRIDTDFTLPVINTDTGTGCTAQTLQLMAAPAQYSKRIWANIKSVNITKLEASQ